MWAFYVNQKIKDMRFLLIVVFRFIITEQDCFCQDISPKNEVWTIATIGMGKYFENKTYATLQDTIINHDTFKTIYQTRDYFIQD